MSSGGFAALCQDTRVGIRIDKTIHEVVWQHLGITWLVHFDAAEHLPDDDLDMFIIDIHTGVAIDALHFFHHVHLHGLASLDAQDILRVTLPGSDGGAGLNLLSLADSDIARCRDGIRTFFAFLKANAQETIGIDERLTFGASHNRDRLIAIFRGHESDDLVFVHVLLVIDEHLAARGQVILIEEDVGRDDAHRARACSLVLDDFNHAVDFADLGLVLRDAGLKEFFDARQTLGDVSLCSRDTTGMEGTHSQLRARLTNGLSGDDADGCAGSYQRIGGEIAPVALAADAAVCQAAKHRTYAHSFDTRVDYLVDEFVGQFVTRLDVIEFGNRAASFLCCPAR